VERLNRRASGVPPLLFVQRDGLEDYRGRTDAVSRRDEVAALQKDLLQGYDEAHEAVIARLRDVGSEISDLWDVVNDRYTLTPVEVTVLESFVGQTAQPRVTEAVIRSLIGEKLSDDGTSRLISHLRRQLDAADPGPRDTAWETATPLGSMRLRAAHREAIADLANHPHLVGDTRRDDTRRILQRIASRKS
jgi:hypothetical protein